VGCARRWASVGPPSTNYSGPDAVGKPIAAELCEAGSCTMMQVTPAGHRPSCALVLCRHQEDGGMTACARSTEKQRPSAVCGEYERDTRQRLEGKTY
jgi:hypothetical protein